MTTFKPHCSLDYHEFGPVELETKSHAISTGIYGNNPPFASPPVATQLLFDGTITTYHGAYEAYKNGGVDQKGAFLTARTTLIAQLDTTAGYVDGLAGVDEDMITLAGFTPTKTGGSSAVLPFTPAVIKITRGVTGEFFAECEAQQGVAYYGCLVTAGGPLQAGMGIDNAGQFIIYNDNTPPTPPSPSTTGNLPNGAPVIIVDITKGRKKHFTGLTKGIDYYFYFCAANAAGVSQLSEPVIMMCA